MRYTKRKIRGINFSFLLAGIIFAGWSLVCAWFGFPRSLRHGSAAAFALFLLAAIFFTAFPIIWARYPAKHPVNHDLSRYGELEEVSARLDREMSGRVEILGPFHFTETMLVYDIGHEFQMIPYTQIASAEVDQPTSDDPAAVVVRTRTGKRYQWFRTWMQGRFNPQEVVDKIRAKAGPEETPKES